MTSEVHVFIRQKKVLRGFDEEVATDKKLHLTKIMPLLKFTL